MTDQTDKRDPIPTLEERVLMPLAASDTGWVQDRPQLSDRGIAQLRSLLGRHLSAAKVDGALGIIRIGFSDAVEAALVERRAAIEADASKDAKKPSSKLGVRLRGCLDDLLQLLDLGGGSPEEICASILAEPELARLVTVHLEERMRPLIADPLEHAPSAAMEHLPEGLRSLRDAIDQGVTRGPVEAAHDIIAKTVFSALLRATGQAPKRNWDAIKSEDSGYGLACCKILAQELNTALPPELRRPKALNMARAWRRVIEKDDEAS